MRSYLPGQSDSAGPSVVWVGGHAKKLVRLGDTKSGSGEGYGHPPLPVRWSACMYVCVCVYVPAPCARTHDRQRVPETRIHAMHAGSPGTHARILQ